LKKLDTLQIKIGEGLKKELKEICDKADFHMSEFIRQAIRTRIRDEKIILDLNKGGVENEGSG